MRTSPRICADDNYFTLNYDIGYGNIELHSVVFDSKAQKAGFSDIEKQTANGSYIDVPLPTNVLPDTYAASVVFHNGPITKSLPISFTINYPSSIILQKWNDVLALLNSSYNGGYDFINFQWYKNGQAIDGATKSYLYTANDKLDMTAEYSVKATRINDGVSVFSCPVKPTQHSEIKIYPTLLSKSSSVKIMIDENGTAILMSVSGLKINEQRLVKGDNSMIVPDTTGSYLLIITNNKGESKKQLLVVK